MSRSLVTLLDLSCFAKLALMTSLDAPVPIAKRNFLPAMVMITTQLKPFFVSSMGGGKLGSTFFLSTTWLCDANDVLVAAPLCGSKSGTTCC